MSTITLEIPEQIKYKLKIWETVSYETLILKTIWKEYISPDLEFTKYEDMSKSHKEEYDKLENIDKSKLLNI